MRIFCDFFLLLVGFFLFLSTAQAYDFKIGERDFSLQITNTLGYTYHADNGDQNDTEDKFHQLLESLDVSLSHAEYRLGGRLDAHLFADTPFDRLCHNDELNAPAWCNQRDARYVNTLTPERLFFIVARPEFDLTMGDFYVSFGKGMALNVVKISELGQDTTIRGGKFVLHHHDLELTFLSGQFNPLNLDEASGRLAPWPLEPIVASRLEYRFFEKLIAGAHGVLVISDNPHPSDEPTTLTDQNFVAGATLEIPKLWNDHLALSGEMDWQRTIKDGVIVRGIDAESEGTPGLAGYANATFHQGALTATAEFKYYDQFQLRAPTMTNEPYVMLYHQPPTLERITAEVSDNTSTSGGRLRLDYNFEEVGPLTLLVFANYGYFHNWSTGDHRIHDPYGGLEADWQDGRGHLQLTSGMRQEYSVELGEVYRRDIHLEIDLEQSIIAQHSLKATWTFLRRSMYDDINMEEDKWHESDLALTYKWSPRWSVAATYEMQNDPRIEGAGGQNNFGGSMQYYFTPSTYLSLHGGKNRAGIKCLNGMCRYYPSFAGGQALFVGRF